MSNSINKHRLLQYLSSYQSWKFETAKPIVLAEAGLYFTGKDDITMCKACGLELSNWKQEDDPAVLHRTRSPYCSALTARLTDEQVDCVANDTLLSLHSMNYKSSDSNDRIDASRTTARTPAFKPSFIEACIQTCSRRITGKCAPPTAASHPLPKVVVDRRKPDFKLLQSDQKLRLSTFNDFPDRAAQIISVDSLAKNGFFYTGQGDKVQCAYCQGCLHGWEKGDKAEDEHRRHFPECSFVQAGFRDAPQVPLLQVCMDEDVNTMLLHCDYDLVSYDEQTSESF